MISYELLDAVYPNDETEECHVGIQESVRFGDRVMWFGNGGADDCRSEIDIHRVAHRCKEWALSKNYILQSSIEIDCGYCEISYIILNEVKKVLITAESEPEAVFKACEWILEKMKENK